MKRNLKEFARTESLNTDMAVTEKNIDRLEIMRLTVWPHLHFDLLFFFFFFLFLRKIIPNPSLPRIISIGEFSLNYLSSLIGASFSVVEQITNTLIVLNSGGREGDEKRFLTKLGEEIIRLFR